MTMAAPTLFEALQAAAPGQFAYCRNRILAHAPDDPGTTLIDGPALLDPVRFEAMLRPFVEKAPGADRRIVISMWSLYYFSALFIPATLGALVLKRTMPLGLGETRIVFDTKAGTPKSFLVTGTGPVGTGDIHRRMRPVIEDHAAPVIDFLNAYAGVSPKLLWNNITPYVAWAIDEAASHVDPALRDEGYRLLDDARGADGAANPFFGLMNRTGLDGEGQRRRKVCCLRYLLPGVAYCGALCPVPESRIQRQQ
ncbi:siderophore-iron reductase FhuF [Nitratireductor sp. ZSWI3]|uniref:siderophore-iron reductase FhuF n=1 Tax=Nitratireductor sp. ZSWI3 TaxID=2966359 RepID=UPI00214FC785|nr:siderophore-iron reductase FhuF [Nitratireductor sp. ZSWI3]MCR4266162.1 siderophore-iron reductase FhuF [Nitratireductor sp. ZSWI3]